MSMSRPSWYFDGTNICSLLHQSEPNPFLRLWHSGFMSVPHIWPSSMNFSRRAPVPIPLALCLHLQAYCFMQVNASSLCRIISWLSPCLPNTDLILWASTSIDYPAQAEPYVPKKLVKQCLCLFHHLLQQGLSPRVTHRVADSLSSRKAHVGGSWGTDKGKRERNETPLYTGWCWMER